MQNLQETAAETRADALVATPSVAASETVEADDAPLAFDDVSDLARGLACASGRDREVDLVEAHKWFSIAAAGGCREALVHRAEIAREMSVADIARAQRAARDQLRLH